MGNLNTLFTTREDERRAIQALRPVPEDESFMAQIRIMCSLRDPRFATKAEQLYESYVATDDEAEKERI